jgi:tripartite-type tricarboxylate transporter receptor subunit TctC
MLFTGCSTNTGGDQQADDNQKTADDYPTKPIRIIVGHSAGGGNDRAARILQPFLEEELGTSVVVENIDGAGGMIAATTIVRDEPDGYYIGAMNQPHLNFSMALNDTIYEHGDLIPIWIEVKDPIIFAVKKDSPWNDFEDFINAAKDNPGKYAIGVVANSGQQANALWLQSKLGLDHKVVTYAGGSQAAAALLGGHIDAIYGDAFSRYDMRDELKCLGIASTESSPLWPEGKPFNEQLKPYGLELPVSEFGARFGAYWVRKELKEQYPERYEILKTAFQNIAANEEYRKKMDEAGQTPVLVLEDGEAYQDGFLKELNVIKEELVPLFEQQKK